jgi:RNA polymerase sigma-70 factor (ECF subfamily)
LSGSWRRRREILDSHAKLAARDPAAWEAAYQAHHRDLYGFIARLLRGDRTLADELFQEAWLEAIRQIVQFSPQRGAFRAWLFGIARRRVAYHWRRHALRNRTEDAIGDASATTTTLLPHDILEQIERGQVVEAALLFLQPDDRELLLRRYTDGETIAEIARHYGRTAKAVESRLARLRQELRELLSPYIDDTLGESAHANRNT